MVIHHKPSLKACKKSEHLVTKLAILAFLVHKIGQLVKWNVKITVMLTLAILNFDMLFEDDARNRKLGDRCVGEQVAFKDFKFAKDAVTGAIR